MRRIRLEFGMVLAIIIVLMSIVGQFNFGLQIAYADITVSETDGENKVLIIGDDINYPPYSFLNENNKPEGFSIELVEAAANAMGYDVIFELDKWNEVRTNLENQEIDVIAGMFYSESREENYNFTTPHSIATGDVFSLRKNRIESIEDLRGQTVVVQNSDIIHEYLMEKKLEINFVAVATVGEALEMVNKGLADYAALLKPTAHYIIEQEKLKKIVSSGLKLVPQKYCMAVNKENTELVHILNGGLQVLKATGEYQIIYDKWLGVYEDKTIGELVKAYLWLFLAVGASIVALIAMTLLLRRMVAVKTKEIQSANIKLLDNEIELTANNNELIAMNEENEANLEEIMAIESELRSHYERLLESESELKHSESRARAVINAIPDVLFIFDFEGIITECHANDHTSLTKPKASFIGMSILDILPIKSRDKGFKVFKETFIDNKIKAFEYEIEIRNEKRYFEIRMSKSQEGEVIGITRDITDDYSYKQKIEFLSYHDQLTGLFNRRYFEEELAQLDKSSNLPFTLIMADVNGLKLVNDSFGHNVGDQLLKKMAQVLSEACADDHAISRIGGDEFVIMLPKMDGRAAEELIDKIRKVSAVEKIAGIELSISYGWATKNDLDEHILDVLNKAEDYMYKRKLFEGPSMRSKTIGAIIQTLHEKNQREEEHSKRVSDYCEKLAKAMGFNDKDVAEMGSVGLLHDIGKIAIAEDLLNKPGKLTVEEMEEVRRHPEIGYRILSSVNDMSELSDYVLYHHERWDGGGYPRGLKGKYIPIQSRMIAIADSFDAMTSERSYKASMSKKEAIEELRKNAGSQFDPQMIPVFINKVIGYN